MVACLSPLRTVVYYWNNKVFLLNGQQLGADLWLFSLELWVYLKVYCFCVTQWAYLLVRINY